MLKGVSALVTGAASGIGLATTKRFLLEGAKVTMCDLPNSKGAELAKELNTSDVMFAATDITKEDDVEKAMKTVKETFGKLDLTVNVAGVHYVSKLYDDKKKKLHDLNLMEKIINVNVIGTFNVMRYSSALMAENHPQEPQGQRGVIVNTSSVAAFEGQMGQVAYAASKAAVLGMTLPAAKDLSSCGIRCMTIAPGIFDAPMFNTLPDKVRSHLIKSTPFPKRVGDPDEFARLAVHIYNNQLLNGETIRMDGGLRLFS